MIVFYNQEGERLEPISESDRNVIYTKRTNQILKVCKKYGLTVENVTKSSDKKNVPPGTHYNQLQSNYTLHRTIFGKGKYLLSHIVLIGKCYVT